MRNSRLFWQSDLNRKNNVAFKPFQKKGRLSWKGHIFMKKGMAAREKRHGGPEKGMAVRKKGQGGPPF